MYSVRFYKGNSFNRQQQANNDNCTAYLDFQFNQSKDENLNYSSVAIASNANEITKLWARNFALLAQESFNTPLGGKEGVLIGGRYGKNEADLIYAQMPAILVQPLFATNPLHTSLLKNKSIQLRLARIIAKNIYTIFPNGGLFAFSASSYSKFDDDKPDQFKLDTRTISETILRQASVMIHSHIISSVSSFQTNTFTRYI